MLLESEEGNCPPLEEETLGRGSVNGRGRPEKWKDGGCEETQPFSSWGWSYSRREACVRACASVYL